MKKRKKKTKRKKNGDHFRVEIDSGSIWGSCRVGNHFGVDIILGAVQLSYGATSRNYEKELATFVKMTTLIAKESTFTV